MVLFEQSEFTILADEARNSLNVSPARPVRNLHAVYYYTCIASKAASPYVIFITTYHC
jgi:hypothetical protein